MVRKRQKPTEDIRSLVEKRDDALAKMALYRDNVNHGWLAKFNVKNVIKTSIVFGVLIYVLYMGWMLAAPLLGW